MSRTPRRALVIINPLSGAGRHGSQIDAHTRLAQSILGAHALEVRVRPTTRAGDAHTFACEAVAEGDDLVVAWGGDGTINETASALIHTPVTLGIVPAGSGNGLAADLRIPFEPAAALRVAATGRPMTIDAGTVDEHLFFNIAGVGIDAVIATRFSERGMHRRGLLGYLQLSSAELWRYRCLEYELRIDDSDVRLHALLVAFANGRQYGNRLLIAPGARLDDGLLEVVAVEQQSLLGIAWQLPALLGGSLQTGRGVTMRAARRVQVRAQDPIPFHVDGEPRLGRRELVVSSVPQALRVMVAAV